MSRLSSCVRMSIISPRKILIIWLWISLGVPMDIFGSMIIFWEYSFAGYLPAVVPPCRYGVGWQSEFLRRQIGGIESDPYFNIICLD